MTNAHIHIEKCRIDKWLWHARFFKSRTLAGKFWLSGQVRDNAQLHA